VSDSREVNYVSECCMQSKKWAYWVSHFRFRSPFPTVNADFFLRLPSPVYLRKRVHPLVRFVPLQSTSIPQSADDPKVISAFLGVCGPSSRHRPPAFKLRASHRSSPFRPRRFSRPRRFPPQLALWVYFTPLPRPGFTLQGFSPRPPPYHLSMTVALSSLHRFC